MFSRTTGELSVEHSAPLTIAVDDETDDVMAPQALVTGIVGGGGVGVVGVPPAPPHADAIASAMRSAPAQAFIRIVSV